MFGLESRAPDLDQLVAEKVMGWTRDDMHGYSNPAIYRDGERRPRGEVRHWHPATDGAQAFVVMERLRELGIAAPIDWAMSPMAVCLMSLKLVADRGGKR